MQAVVCKKPHKHFYNLVAGPFQLQSHHSLVDWYLCFKLKGRKELFKREQVVSDTTATDKLVMSSSLSETCPNHEAADVVRLALHPHVGWKKPDPGD